MNKEKTTRISAKPSHQIRISIGVLFGIFAFIRLYLQLQFFLFFSWFAINEANDIRD